MQESLMHLLIGMMLVGVLKLFPKARQRLPLVIGEILESLINGMQILYRRKQCLYMRH